MPSKARKYLVRPLICGAVLTALLVPAGGNAAESPYRRYTFHGAGTVAGKFEIAALASGGRQDHPTLMWLDPVGCYSTKNLVDGILGTLDGTPSSAHKGGFCRHLGYGTVVVKTPTEVFTVRQLCMELIGKTLGFAGPDDKGRRWFVKLVDNGNADKAGLSRTGGIVQQGKLCGASNVPTYRLTAGQFVSSDTGSF